MLIGYGVGRKEAMIKFAAVVLFICFAECAAGSCLNYGHACWGGHGKRSGNNIVLKDTIDNPSALKTRWFLSKLIRSPVDFRYLGDNDLDVASKHSSDPLIGADEDERQEQWRKNQDVLNDEQLFDDNFLTVPDNKRIRIPKVLDKRSTKQN